MEVSESTLKTIPIKEEVVEPSEYLKRRDREKFNIESVQVLPPKLGQKDFGKIKIKYKLPVYKVGLGS